MEHNLRELLDIATASDRYAEARRLQRHGKRIIGVVSDCAPEEILVAAGLLPIRIAGSFRVRTPMASTYRSPSIDQYCTHVLESVLSGELDFLDGILFTYEDDDMRRLWDVVHHLKRFPFDGILHIPHYDSETTRRQLHLSLARLITSVEQTFDVGVSADDLRRAIDLYQTSRCLFKEVYDLRRKDVPPLSGAECHRLMMACCLMDRVEFNQKLGTLLGYLNSRRAPLARFHPRLLVSSDYLHDTRIVTSIEDLGAVVAMDDWEATNLCLLESDGYLDDPLHALAGMYLSRTLSPRQYAWDLYAARIAAWAREYAVSGVVSIPHPGARGRWRELFAPYLMGFLTGAGIPAVTVGRQYYLPDPEQLVSRVRPFVETLRDARDGGCRRPERQEEQSP